MLSHFCGGGHPSWRWSLIGVGRRRRSGWIWPGLPTSHGEQPTPSRRHHRGSEVPGPTPRAPREEQGPEVTARNCESLIGQSGRAWTTSSRRGREQSWRSNVRPSRRMRSSSFRPYPSATSGGRHGCLAPRPTLPRGRPNPQGRLQRRSRCRIQPWS